MEQPKSKTRSLIMIAVLWVSTGALLISARYLRDWAWLIIAVLLAGFPAFLYMRFVGFRGPSVWNEYVFNLHRLRVEDPHNLPVTLHDDDEELDRSRRELNIYCQKFDAHYGASNRRRWQRGEHADAATEPQPFWATFDSYVPVMMATIFLAIGWTAVFSEPRFLSGNADPVLEAMRAGFLGAYIFDLQLLVRRYLQNDLKPVTYFSVMERLTIVPIIVAVVHQLLPMTGRGLAAAFTIGIFPLLGLRVINGFASKWFKSAVRSLETPYPLSQIDGMTIWQEARLLEEGVEDLQSLAHANVVELLLRTRIPAGQLVDWIDQSYLYLHMEPRSPGTELPESHLTLRRVGIRSATALEDALAASTHVRPEEATAYRKAVRDLLGRFTTLMILECLSNEPNLRLVRNWKSVELGSGIGSEASAPSEAVQDVAGPQRIFGTGLRSTTTDLEQARGKETEDGDEADQQLPGLVAATGR